MRGHGDVSQVVQPYWQLVLWRQISEKRLAHGGGHVEHERSSGLVRPQTLKGGFFSLDVRCTITPGRIDVKALPVVRPAVGGLIDAAIKGETIASAVFENAGFFME